MQAWLLRGFDGIDSLELVHDHPTPEVGVGDVLIRLEYAGLNPADRYLAERAYPAKPAFPHILGRDGAGLVQAVANGEQRWKVGDRVTILRGDAGVDKPGTFAEFVAVPGDRLAVVPDGWSMAEAAAAPLVFLTAWQALTCWGPVPAESSVLITGASGGVGVATILLARALDLTPIALSRGTAKSLALLELGAKAVFDPADPDLVDKVKQAAGPARVALAVDNIGGQLFPKVVAMLGDRGAVSCVGRLAGPVPSFNTAALFFKRLRIGGVSVGAMSPGEAQECWRRIVALLGARRPVIDRVYDFGQLPEAFARLAEGPLGKVLVRVS